MNTTTRHAADCGMAFGRKDPKCPRCAELLSGAAPRVWAGSARKRTDALFVQEIRNHRCGHSCGPVCTFGEW